MRIIRWKFLRLKDNKIKSDRGDIIWGIGKWHIHRGSLDMCQAGFHCSQGIYQAFSFVQGEILAKVECEGRSIIQDDKEVYEKMRIVRAYKWQKRDSIALAIYAAKLVLPIFEKQYPNDKRPHEAIEATVRYLKNPTKKNRIAATTWAAEAATWSAEEAIWAAEAELFKKIELWMKKRFRKLGEIK